MKNLKKIGSKISTSILALFIMFSLVQLPIHAATTNELWVNGVNIITAGNKTVKCGDGEATYNDDTSTLTLDNAKITQYTSKSGTSQAIYANFNFNILLKGTNSISGDMSEGILTEKSANLTIFGDGSLDIVTGNVFSENCIKSSGNLTITDCTITMATKLGRSAALYVVNGNLVVNNANVTAISGDTADDSRGIYTLSGSITMSDSKVKTFGAIRSIYAKKNIDISGQSEIDAECSRNIGIDTLGIISITGPNVKIHAKAANGSPAIKATHIKSDDSTPQTYIKMTNISEKNKAKIATTPWYNPGTSIRCVSTFIDKDDSQLKLDENNVILNAKSEVWLDNSRCALGHGYTKFKDLTNSFHETNCDVCNNYLKESHTFGAWIIDKSATETSKGSKYRECVCGQKETQEIPVINVTPEKPVITAGAGSTHLISNSKDMILTCSGKLEDLTGIYVDNQLVEKSNYTLKSGSTILTLKSSYLDTLSSGKHTLKFQYKDGLFADTTFTVTIKANPTKPEQPQTGDIDRFILMMSLLVLSSGVATFELKKKKLINK